MKFKSIFIMLVFLLAGCASATTSTPPNVTVTSEVTVTSAPTATLTPSSTATLSPEEQITAMVKESKETGILPVLTEVEMSAFINELNRQCGLQVFAYPVPNDSSTIWVNVRPDLYPNFDKEFTDVIKGRGDIAPSKDHWEEYGDASDNFILPKNFFETERGKNVAEKLRQEKWIQMKIDSATKQLSFRYNGEWLNIPGSENLTVADWQEVITKDNIDEKISNGEFVAPKYNSLRFGKTVDGVIKLLDSKLIPTVLLPIPDNGLSRFVSNRGGMDILPILYVHFIPNTNGEMTPIGEVIYYGNTYLDGFVVLEEGSKKALNTGFDDTFRERKFEKAIFIRELNIYYIAPGVFTVERSDVGIFKQLVQPPLFTPLKQAYDILVNPDPKIYLRNKQFILIIPDGLGMMIHIIQR